jgi:hypothetical protein
MGAPSLTRGRVCLLSVIVRSSPLSFVQFLHLELKSNYTYNIYKAIRYVSSLEIYICPGYQKFGKGRPPSDFDWLDRECWEAA